MLFLYRTKNWLCLDYLFCKFINNFNSLHIFSKGGQGGMADFIHTTEFRALNAGFSLDEGTNISNDLIYFKICLKTIQMFIGIVRFSF